MLVLTRKLQEKIQIGEGITITVLRTKGKSVRLGIEAPMEVPVIRGELAFGHVADATHGDDVQVVAQTVATSVDAGRGVTKATRTMPNWDADYVSDRLPRVEKQVSLQRVPRNQVAGAIVAPIHTAPLRAMVERRSLTA